MLWFKKRVSVMNGKPFVAAYSDKGFTESKKRLEHPDYTFHDNAETHWCVRVGDISVPWGFGDQGSGFSANGSLTVSRLNVDEASFTGRGLPFVKEGEVFYLYELEADSEGSRGFSPYIRDKLLPLLKRVASRTDSDGFEEAVNALKSDPEVSAMLMEHRLLLKSVTVNKITKTN